MRQLRYMFLITAIFIAIVAAPFVLRATNTLTTNQAALWSIPAVIVALTIFAFMAMNPPRSTPKTQADKWLEEFGKTKDDMVARGEQHLKEIRNKYKQ